MNEWKLICVYSDRKEHKYTFEVYNEYTTKMVSLNHYKITF